MRAFLRALQQTLRLFASQRLLWVPFLLVALLETCFLVLIWLAPQAPFSVVLAPPIRFFFGDRILHYPAHLWFLYHAMKYTNLVTSVLLGAFFSGVACVMVQQAHEGQPMSFRDALVSGQVRYARVAWLWLLTWGIARGVMQGFSHVGPKTVAMAWTAIGLTVVLQALLVYAIPAAVFNRAPWWKALFQGLREAIRYPLSTLGAVILPTAAVIAFAVAFPSGRVGYLMQTMAPEIAVAFVVGRLLLWTVADTLLTVTIAHLWWLHRAPSAQLEGARAPRPAPRATSLVVSLALLLAVLTLTTGCGANYTGERLFWKAQKSSAAILKDPKSASPQQVESAIANFEVVAKRSRGTMWAARALLTIGSLRATQQQYDQAREVFRQVIQNYPELSQLCLGARMATVKTYELEQRWDDAIKAYQEISDYYPWETVGMEAPLYIARFYQARHQPEQETKAFERAVNIYTKLIPEAPTPASAVRVKGYLALAYQRLQEWDKAIAVLRDLAGTTEGGVNRPLVLLLLGSIYQEKIGDAAKAQEALSMLSKEFPEHPFSKVANMKLEHLKATLVPQPAPAPTPAAKTP